MSDASLDTFLQEFAGGVSKEQLDAELRARNNMLRNKSLLNQIPAASVISYGNITKTAASDFSKPNGLVIDPPKAGGTYGLSVNPNSFSGAFIPTITRRSKTYESRTRKSVKSGGGSGGSGGSSGEESVLQKAKRQKGVVPPQLRAYLFKKGNKIGRGKKKK